MSEKIIKFTSGSDIATKEFELSVVDGKYILTVCAYGEWWDEEFSSLDDLKKYLIIEWNFKDFSFLDGDEKLKKSISRLTSGYFLNAIIKELKE